MIRTRVHEFQDLMRHRIEEVLLVASPYDAFILEQDEQLDEQGPVDLDHLPDIKAVSSGAEALSLATRDTRSRLILTTSHIGDMSAVDLARKVRDVRPGIPVVLLAYDSGEVNALAMRPETGDVIEFKSDRIEQLQDEIARELGYDIVHHRLELYGRKRRAG